ncbi:MAG: PadR family transcriptional regulator [Litorimonas sp.]
MPELRSKRGGRGKGPRGSKNGANRRGGRKRPLAHGDLRLLILNIIKTTPSHGYGLINEIKTLTSGVYEPSPGVIYPALEALQDLGWVEIQPEKGKRVLHITDAGHAELLEQSEAIKLIEERLKTLSSTEQPVEPDDIRGALRQLRHTTVSTFKGQNLDSEAREKAVSILEDARKKISELG